MGFALQDEELKSQMAAWAEAGDGTYFDAAGADELAASLATALSAPFRAYGPDGGGFEGGTVSAYLCPDQLGCQKPILWPLGFKGEAELVAKPAV